MRLKKTCNGCKADNSSGCLLRYIRKSSYNPLDDFPVREFSPLEVCPKPKTNKELVRLLKQ